MDDRSYSETDRLLIQPITTEDESFIYELVNTEGWIRFIGDKNVHSLTDARAYIQRILDNRDILYWVVRLKENGEKIGLVTFIKRTYLEHHDIGFAFLPRYGKQGYAHEATNAVLGHLVRQQQLPFIFATTLPDNSNSILLLEKLGLVFQKELPVENQTLHLYGAPADKLNIKKE